MSTLLTTPYNNSMVTGFQWEKDLTQIAEGKTKVSLACRTEKSGGKWLQAQLSSYSHIFRWFSATLSPSLLCAPLFFSRGLLRWWPLVSPQVHYPYCLEFHKEKVPSYLLEKTFPRFTLIRPKWVSCATSNQPLWWVSSGLYTHP